MLNTLSTLIIKDFEGETDENDCFLGPGQVTYHTGNTYSGSFANGQMEGKGVYVWKDDGTVFSGDFSRNKIIGQGEYVW
jgi:hypothetical protein